MIHQSATANTGWLRQWWIQWLCMNIKGRSSNFRWSWSWSILVLLFNIHFHPLTWRRTSFKIIQPWGKWQWPPPQWSHAYIFTRDLRDGHCSSAASSNTTTTSIGYCITYIPVSTITTVGIWNSTAAPEKWRLWLCKVCDGGKSSWV